MSAAERALVNAIPLELKKDAMRQTQSGDWKITFTVQAADMDQRLTSAAMGTRFQAALVEIGDDELPKEQPKGKLDWRDVQPAAQAGIRCAEPRFRDYLAVEHGIDTKTAQEAAEAVRKLCGVNSRSQLGVNHKARMLWHQIDAAYREWAHL
ncbi:hypothetical protein V1290_000012 [Bradyrhizobium sp. AZCC 1578]|uniref:hypothetical protein n=1 Tax=Bradyrhizobium sp. AZCC 1578 TaxID=3117027 RepID=UPI002FF0B505